MIVALCETANCSWPLIPTLAACGGCTSTPVTSSCNLTAKTCTYNNGAASLSAAMGASEYSSFAVSPSEGTAYPIDTNNRAYFSVFDTLSVSQVDDEEVLVIGTECALWFCIQSFSISVNGGSQTETVVGNWSTATMRRDSSSHGAEHIFVDVPADQLNVDNSTRYTVTHEAMTALRLFMTGVTTGTVYADVSRIDYSSDWVMAMWNASSHLEDWIATFAESMTNEIRRHGTFGASGANRRYDGYATQLAPFIRVQWFWLIYPCVMIFLSLYYLFQTVVDSARDGVPVWKGNALPMLFCRVDQNIHDRVGTGMDEPGGLEERLGHLRVAMYRHEEGYWGFRTTSAEEN